MNNDLMQFEYHPVGYKPNELVECKKIPLTDIAALGTVFASIPEGLRTVTQATTLNNAGRIFQATNLGATEALALDKAGQAYGMVKNGNTYAKTVRFKELSDLSASTTSVMPINPASICVAVALVGIDKKLDAIQSGQKEILDFVEKKNEADMIGTLNYLGQVLADYKYNFNNGTYIQTAHIKINDILQEANNNIAFYKERIETALNDRKGIFHSDVNVNILISKIQRAFTNYQRALYLFGYATFLNAIYLNSYNTDYLNEKKKIIQDEAFRYIDLYSKSYELMNEYQESSLETSVVEGIGALGKIVGEAAGKNPKLDAMGVDDIFLNSSNKIADYLDKKSARNMDKVIEAKGNCVLPFIQSIDELDSVYNHTENIYFDDKYIYLQPERKATAM